MIDEVRSPHSHDHAGGLPVPKGGHRVPPGGRCVPWEGLAVRHRGQGVLHIYKGAVSSRNLSELLKEYWATATSLRFGSRSRGPREWGLWSSEAGSLRAASAGGAP